MENNYDNLSEENFLPGIGKENPFVHPEGYFNSFYDRMLNQIDFEQELEEYKTLAGIDRKLKFAIPVNYFQSLENILEYKYELSLYPELNKISKNSIKNLPDDYFETLDKKIMDRLELSAELEEFKVLSSLEKKNSFSVVPDYFDNNVSKSAEKYQSANRPVISIFRQIQVTLLQPKMAYAAGIALLISLSAIWYFKKDNSPLQTTGDCKTLACVEKRELLNEKTIGDFDDESLYDMVDVDQLDKNVSEEGNSSMDSTRKDIKE